MNLIERARVVEAIATALQAEMSTSDINTLLAGLGVRDGLQSTVSSKRVYAKELLANVEDSKIEQLAREVGVWKGEQPTSEAVGAAKAELAAAGRDPTAVFVVHGRNDRLRRDFFGFLRAAGLNPIEWSEALALTGKGSPYIGEILDHAFEVAQAVVVLLTPDDEVRLRPELWGEAESDAEKEFHHQARPNVLFEAGMAFGRHPDRTILIQVGDVKGFSDVAGRHIVRLSNDASTRLDVLNRLKTAGCVAIFESRRDWFSSGDFSLPIR